MNEDDSLSESEPQSGFAASGPKFEKSKLRTLVTELGGKAMTEFPTEGLQDQAEELITVADSRCVTMTYLLALSHQVPVVSHVYIHDCVSSGKLLERTAYLLPAGFSTLLMREVEQRQDCRQELRINDCLLPSPPATSTRQSNRTKEDDLGRKILSGLHVLVLSTDRDFTGDWGVVLDALGAAVTKRSDNKARLAQLRPPDVVVADSKVPHPLQQDLLKRNEIPIVSSLWIMQCVVNNARIAFNNFRSKLST